MLAVIDLNVRAPPILLSPSPSPLPIFSICLLLLCDRHGYAEVANLPPAASRCGPLILRGLWFTPCAEPSKDPVIGYSLFKRWNTDHATLPSLVPLPSVLAVEHVVHFCGGGGHACDINIGRQGAALLPT